MIEVTRLNGSPLFINAELIESVEETPDTVITLTTGKKILVREDANCIVEKVIRYRNKIRGIIV